MSETIEAAVAALSEKIADGFDGSAKFVVQGEGSVMIDADGVRADDGDADVTLSADAETFSALLEGELDPTAAYMSGRLAIDGDMGMAMRLGAILA